MAGSAPHIPDDDIEAAAQQPAQDENAPAKGDERSLSDKAESIPKLPEDHMEAMAQQALPAENAPADGDRSSHSNELPKLTYEQLLYEYNVGTRNVDLANVFLEFRNLSRMTIIHLMNELAKYEQRIIFKGTANLQDIEHLEDLMHRYSKSVRAAVVVVFSLRCLHNSYRCSRPRILVQTPQIQPIYFQTYSTPKITRHL